jgi:ubiquinone/menaquinone biosynthesis C-methylase UbiE
MHDESEYDKQYGVDSDHPEEGAGLCNLVRRAGFDTEGPAVEIGCGTGYLTTGLVNSGVYPEFLITDPSPPFLGITRKRLQGLQRQEARQHFAVLNAEDIRHLPGEAFSLIAMRSTLHHISDVPQFFADSAKALRPNGVLAMSAEPCEEGYVLMGALASCISSVLSAAGVTIKGKWSEQLQNFTATMEFYCRRDLDKTLAEDKHLFRVHELALLGATHGLRLDFRVNASYADFETEDIREGRGSFASFFPMYLRYCMSFDPDLVELVKVHMQPQISYIDRCYSGHAGPVFNGVFLFSKTIG